MLRLCNNFFRIWSYSSILLQGISIPLQPKNRVRHEKYHKYRIEGHEKQTRIKIQITHIIN